MFKYLLLKWDLGTLHCETGSAVRGKQWASPNLEGMPQHDVRYTYTRIFWEDRAGSSIVPFVTWKVDMSEYHQLV